MRKTTYYFLGKNMEWRYTQIGLGIAKINIVSNIIIIIVDSLHLLINSRFCLDDRFY